MTIKIYVKLVMVVLPREDILSMMDENGIEWMLESGCGPRQIWKVTNTWWTAFGSKGETSDFLAIEGPEILDYLKAVL